ncbi:hypothetical protein ADK38_03325, partial [Streptomyces varsoviensis]
MVRGGSRRTTLDAGVAAAEFDDEPAAQALPLYRRGEHRVRGVGPRSLHGKAPRAPARVPARVDEFDADHEPSASYVADPLVLLAQPPQPGRHPLAEQGGALGESVLAHVLQGRRAGRHGELVAAEGSGVGAGRPGVQFLAVDDDRERQAAA